MKRFCHNFWSDLNHDEKACPECSLAIKEIAREFKILDVVGPITFKRDELKSAGLDSKGRP